MRNFVKSLLIICILGINTNIYSQVNAIGSFLAAGPADAEKLLEGYMSPWLYAFGASLTGGWYNTAKVHKPGGFDITATFNTAFVPTSAKTFDVSELGLEGLVPNDPNNTIASSGAGEKIVGPQLDYNIDLPAGIERKAFDMPKGVALAYIPTPMLQASIGLFKGTEIVGRYMPTFKVGDENKIGMWGVGLKHGLKQWIPGIEKIPVLHLTLMGGYTQLNGQLGINVDPTMIGLSDFTGSNWDDQSMELTTKSWTGNVIISANLPVVCFYGAVGFATAQTQLALKGNYPWLDPTDLDKLENLEASELSDPVDFTVKYDSGGIAKPRFNVGMRLKLGPVTLNGDYTWAEYSMFTAGLGISFR